MISNALIHICCAPDATVVFERLRSVYNITGYFYNPNIHPADEYELRTKEMKNLAHNMGIPLEMADYDSSTWFKLIKGLEKEPEGGDRCKVCVEMRLDKTAYFAAKNKFDIFTTVLTVSPHKNADLINELGQTMANKYSVKFLEANFKKNDGFKRSLELSKYYNLYRQNYCGCIYSKK